MDPHPSRGHRRGMNITGLEILPGSKGFKLHIRCPSLGRPTPGRWVLLAGVKTIGAYQRAVRTQDSILKRAHTQTYSQSHHEGRRLKFPGALASPPGHPLHTSSLHGLLLQPILLRHCSPLRQSLSLPMRLHIFAGNGASWDPSTASVQCGGRHCQLMSPCAHLRVDRVSSVVRHYLCSTKPASKDSVHTRGESETSTEVQAQALKPWLCPKSRWRLPTHLGESQIPQGSCSSSSSLIPAPDRAVMVIEHRRCPDLLHLALAVAQLHQHHHPPKQDTQGKDTACALFRSSSPTRAPERTYAECRGTLPHKDTPPSLG